MILYLLRHSKAEKITEGILDKDRKLTDEGKSLAFIYANKWKKKLSDLNLILTSPYPRALETATIFASVLKKDNKLSILDCLNAQASAEEVLNLLTDYADQKEILLVGHLPWLTELASLIIAGTGQCQIKLKKPGLIKLEIKNLNPLGGKLLELR